jgi:hypothetical protein
MSSVVELVQQNSDQPGGDYFRLVGSGEQRLTCFQLHLSLAYIINILFNNIILNHYITQKKHLERFICLAHQHQIYH